MDKRFDDYADWLIDNIEGGYYHPNMKKANPEKFKAMGSSGETMFGMDRVAGKGLFTSGVGKDFWDLIDKLEASSKWEWGYKCDKGTDALFGPILRHYAAEIMYNQYTKLSSSYLKGYTDIISKDPCLEIHLFYACWNGSGWFQHFAQDLKNEIDRQNGLIAKGKQAEIDFNLLRVCALNSRVNNYKGNSLISKGGSKIQSIWKKYLGKDVQLVKEYLKKLAAPSGSNNWLWWLAGGLVVAGGICFLGYKKWGWFGGNKLGATFTKKAYDDDIMYTPEHRENFDKFHKEKILNNFDNVRYYLDQYHSGQLHDRTQSKKMSDDMRSAILKKYDKLSERINKIKSEKW